VSASEPLFTIRGKYEFEAKAASIMAQGQQWVEYSLTPDTLVAPTSQEPLKQAFPKKLCTVNEVLVHLQSLGEVGVTIRKHLVERLPGDITKYNVKVQDRIALQLKPLQCEPDKVNLGNISNYVDFAEIKNSPYLRVLHKLLFETSATSLQSGYPAVYLTKPLKLQKDVMVKLTKHWVSHGAGYNPCIYAAKPVLDELLQLSHHQFRHTALDDSTTTQLCHNISSNGRINWIKIIDHPWAGQGFVV
jgi:hypothetical protein